LNYLFFEEALFSPRTFAQKVLVRLLAPLSFIYSLFATRSFVKKSLAQNKFDAEIPVISVGNLIVGGSGKTPLTAAIARFFYDRGVGKIAIVSRGYKRKSKNLIVLDEKSDFNYAGDEAILYRELLPKAIVIVSRDRKLGITKAKELGAEMIFLDDGFRHKDILKTDILIKPAPEPANNFCLPAGYYRLPKNFYKFADFIAVEGEDFNRIVKVENGAEKMILITAIARSNRLDKFLPQNVIAKYSFPDHSAFDFEHIKSLMRFHGADAILVTQKDLVKLAGFDAPIALLKLEIALADRLKTFLLKSAQKS
jgi:tetraacyldisaccharide 4'-kinase